MNRATRRRWLVASIGMIAAAVTGAACTTAGNVTPLDHDGGSVAPRNDASVPDASLADDSGGGSSDGAPTLTDDATLSDSATDDASQDGAPAAETGPTGCKKPSPSDPCGLDPQCGCPAFETCDVDGGAGTVCTTAGSAALGHGCATTASCDTGLTCFNGVCRPYCTNTGDAGCNAKLAEGGTCTPVVGDDGGPLPNDDVCSFHCQPEDPNACGQTGDLYGGCIPNDDGTTDCIGVGLSKLGDNCTYLNDCLPGLVCVGQCVQWCRVGHSPSDCGGADAGACQAFGDPLTVYGVQYGYCP